MFCKEKKFENDLFTLLNSYVIQMSPEEIVNIYNYWKEYFDAEIQPENGALKQDRNRISTSHNIPTSGTLLGIDFPIWFNTEIEKPKIMVLGIDPLRNKNIFKKMKADTNQNVIIGTPYALDNYEMRHGRTKQYWNFINKLNEKNFVYITDIYKIFYSAEGQQKSSDYFKKNNKFQELLKQEIELVKPDIIVTLGCESYYQLTRKRLQALSEININEIPNSKFEGIPVIPMLHLSGLTRTNLVSNFLEINHIVGYDNNPGIGYSKMIENYLAHN